MVRVSDGTRELCVTRSAYESYFKRLGYKPLGVALTAENLEQENTHHSLETPLPEDSAMETPQGEEVVEDTSEAEPEKVQLSEIPISEMSGDQLKQYADELGIDYSEVRYKRDLRNLIREHLRK